LIFEGDSIDAESFAVVSTYIYDYVLGGGMVSLQYIKLYFTGYR
jgi:hypothetical protein